MKIFTVILSILFLSACSWSNPEPPEPRGKWVKINSPHYYKDKENANFRKDRQ